MEERGTIDDVSLREIAAEERIPVGTIEKDLALVCALHRLSTSPLKRHLVFKGGTARKYAWWRGDQHLTWCVWASRLDESGSPAL